MSVAAMLLYAAAARAQQVTRIADDSLRMIRLQEVEVTATRATATTPVAHSNLSSDEIARNSYGYDIPSVLALPPNETNFSMVLPL